jgi:hypothetical protein
MAKIIPIFQGEAKDGRLYIRDRDLFTGYLRQCEGVIDVVVKKHRKQRSNRQNRYYRGVILPLLAQELGYTNDEMNEIIKAKFFLIPEREITTARGVIITVPSHTESTSDSNTGEFEEKLEDIRQWASYDLGLYLPLPNEALPQKYQ